MCALLHKMATFKLEAFHIKVYKMKSGFLWGKKKKSPPQKKKMWREGVSEVIQPISMQCK